ncbi:IS66 family insertion sequence element accessory protein TnpB [Escherichia coli]|nr:IS66 family insertion sequence element accessory protein TnpB [Escherichia coli]
MIPLPSGTKIWLVAGITDMRNGFNGLAAKVQTTLKDDPMSGHVFIFRGRNGSQVKLLWSTGDGLCLLTKRRRYSGAMSQQSFNPFCSDVCFPVHVVNHRSCPLYQ